MNQMPQLNAEYVIAGVLTPLISAIIRNARWGGFAKALMMKVVVGISTLALSLMHGKLDQKELLGGVWIYVVSCLVEPQFRTSLLKYIDELTTSWADQAKAKMATNYDKVFREEIKTVEESIVSTGPIDYDVLAVKIAELMSKAK